MDWKPMVDSRYVSGICASTRGARRVRNGSPGKSGVPSGTANRSPWSPGISLPARHCGRNLFLHASETHVEIAELAQVLVGGGQHRLDARDLGAIALVFDNSWVGPK